VNSSTSTTKFEGDINTKCYFFVILVHHQNVPNKS
jgi:hypothetical protein